MKRNCGFTLAEMAIVMVIIGLIMTAMLGSATTQIRAGKFTATKTRLATAQTALVGFAHANNRLPCPANAALPATNPNYGREVGTPGTCTGLPATGGVVRGMLPWRTLGMADGDVNDGWVRRFDYVVSRPFTSNACTGACTPPSANWKTPPGAAGGITIQSGSPILNTTNIAYAVISRGENGLGARLPGGASMAAPTTADETINSGPPNVLRQLDFVDTPASSYFDDILVFEAAPTLVVKSTF